MGQNSKGWPALVKVYSVKHTPLLLLLNPHFRKSRLRWYHVLRDLAKWAFYDIFTEHYCTDKSNSQRISKTRRSSCL